MIIYDIDGTNSGTVLRNVCFEMIYFLNVQAFVNTAAFGAGIMLYKKKHNKTRDTYWYLDIDQTRQNLTRFLEVTICKSYR